MSTTGKVLTVLVLLVTIVWVLLISKLAEFHSTGTQALQAAKDEGKKIQDETVTEQELTTSLRDDLNLEQVKLGEALGLIAVRQAALEQKRSAALANASHLKFLDERAAVALQHAEADRDHRKVELAAEQKALADVEAEVKKLQGVNAGLMEQLAKLRDDFKKTFAANREKVRRTSR